MAKKDWLKAGLLIQVKETGRLGDIIKVKGKKALIRLKSEFPGDEEVEDFFTQAQIQQVLPW